MGMSLKPLAGQGKRGKGGLRTECVTQKLRNSVSRRKPVPRLRKVTFTIELISSQAVVTNGYSSGWKKGRGL